MTRIVRIVVALGLTLLLLGSTPAAAAPRASVATPWGRDDPVGDASRPQGDVRRIEIGNGRQSVRFFFRMAQTPVWDTAGTSRATVMRFLIDWKGTSLAHDRRVTVSRSDGGWNTVVFNGAGGALCLRQGGVSGLGANRYQFTVPVNQCLGGPRVLRVAASFADDRDPSALDDIRLDRVPNGGGYGPFISVP